MAQTHCFNQSTGRELLTTLHHNVATADHYYIIANDDSVVAVTLFCSHQ